MSTKDFWRDEQRRLEAAARQRAREIIWGALALGFILGLLLGTIVVSA